MEKISFKDLHLTVDEDEYVEIEKNGIRIQVKQYLSVNTKLKIIGNVLNDIIADSLSFVNPIKVEVFTAIEIIDAYTNIEFSDEDREHPDTIYDLLDKNGYISAIFSTIPKDEYDFVADGIEATIDSYYKYKNSVLGVMETITNDYNITEADINKIQNDIANPDNLTLLKDIMTKLD